MRNLNDSTIVKVQYIQESYIIWVLLLLNIERFTGIGEHSPVTGEFSAQRSSNAENVSIWWRHPVT